MTTSTTKTQILFLRLVSLCFFFAFASLYVQWDGLFGADGLEPVARKNFKRSTITTTIHEVLLSTFPSLLTFHEIMGLSIDLCAELIMISGALLSLLSCCFPYQLCILPVHLTLQWLYLSLYLVGGSFLTFQWDILLLEVGWLACVWSPWLPSCRKGGGTGGSGAAPQWLLRFLLFKLMFQSGVVKIQADCPTWLGLTALDYHYATQCLPTPLAWYAHQVCEEKKRGEEKKYVFV